MRRIPPLLVALALAAVTVFIMWALISSRAEGQKLRSVTYYEQVWQGDTFWVAQQDLADTAIHATTDSVQYSVTTEQGSGETTYVSLSAMRTLGQAMRFTVWTRDPQDSVRVTVRRFFGDSGWEPWMTGGNPLPYLAIFPNIRITSTPCVN